MPSVVKADTIVFSAPAPQTWNIAALSIPSELLPDLGVELTFALCTLALAFIISQVQRRTLQRKQSQKVRRDKPAVPDVVPPTKAKVVAESKVYALARFVEQVISTRLTATKTLQGYEEMREKRKHLNIVQELDLAGSAHTAFDFYGAMVQCAGRTGHSQLVEQLFSDMSEAGLEPPIMLYESAMKLLAGKNGFKEAISVYQLMEKRGVEPSVTSMSCAINFAAELGDHDFAICVFEKLRSQTQPSLRACMAALRVHAKRADWDASAKLLSSVHAQGVEVDSMLLNIVLSTGVATGKVDSAEALLFKEPGASVADVVSFNTILKGLAQSCEMKRTIELLDKMIKRGIEPNLISINTVLDATVRSRRTAETWRVYDLMSKELHMQPDKCTCSTLVKTFVINKHETEQRVTIVLDLIDEVRRTCSDQLLQNLLSGCLAASLRLPPSRNALALAKRAFVGLVCKGKMLASTADLRSVLLTAASLAGSPSTRASDDSMEADALLLLRFAWCHVTDAGADLLHARQAVERRTEEGDGLAAATLAELAGRQTQLRKSGAGARVQESSSKARCGADVVAQVPWRRPARA